MRKNVFSVYTLLEPTDSRVIRYVGFTCLPLYLKRSLHIGYDKSAAFRWINSLRKENNYPVISLVSEFVEELAAQEVERLLILRLLSEDPAILLNRKERESYCVEFGFWNRYVSATESLTTKEAIDFFNSKKWLDMLHEHSEAIKESAFMPYPHVPILVKILRTIDQGSNEKVGLDRLQEVTGYTHPTIKRNITKARGYGVIIEWHQSNGYQIKNWGIFDKKEVRKACDMDH